MSEGLVRIVYRTGHNAKKMSEAPHVPATSDPWHVPMALLAHANTYGGTQNHLVQRKPAAEEIFT